MTNWRVPLRIARREALRAKGRTVLMLVMIALPVMGVTAADVLIQTQDVNSVESMDRRLGTEAAALVNLWGGGAYPIEQSRDPQQGVANSVSDARGTLPSPSLKAVLAALGGDRRGIVYDTGDLDVKTDRGSTTAGVTEVDLRDPLAHGLLDLSRGHLPENAGEVVVNQSLADRGPGLGETVTVVLRGADSKASTKDLKVVGIGESTSVRGWEQVFTLPGSIPDEMDGSRSWLVSGGEVRWDAVTRVNAIGGVVLSRAEILDPSPAAKAADDLLLYDEGIDEATLTVVILVVVMALIEVVLLAGPAFAVGARRQARPLALLAASGGTPAQARRVVLATGVVIGTAGAALGVVLGIGVGAALEPLVQRYADTWFGPFEVPWLHLLGVAAFGFLSALLAAVVPAFIASRQDVVAVLAGRRGDRRLSARSPFVGLALLALGMGVAWAGTESVESSSPLFIGGSAILTVFGMLLVVPVVVVAVAKAGRWLPLPLRFAVRDAARHRTRTTPAVAAVAATVAGVVALGIGVTSDEAQNRETYQPSLAMGAASITADPGADPAPQWQDFVDVVDREAPGAEAHLVLGVPYLYSDRISQSISFQLPGGDPIPVIGSSGMTSTEVLAYDGELPWGAPQLEGFPRQEAVRVLEAGGVVVFAGAEQQISEVEVVVDRYDDRNGEELQQTIRKVPALVVAGEGGAPGTGIIPASLAEKLGMEVTTVTAVLDGASISEEEEKDIAEALNAFTTPGFLYVERGYQAQDETMIIQLVLAALGAVLMLGGTLTATFLALSDARPDLATLSAVGATTRTRRGVAAGYALAVGGVGALLGVLVGFVPGVAATYPLTSTSWTVCTGPDCPVVADHYLDVPWLMIGGLVVVLPLLVAGVVWVFARSRLPLVARLS